MEKLGRQMNIAINILLISLICVLSAIDYTQNIALNKMTHFRLEQEKAIENLQNHIKLQNRMNEIIIDKIGEVEAVLSAPIHTNND